ncbi:uncharacterized protein LOC110693495 [Chenopodium quinoa]|uniref:uncharacterized protein LOC110693495 n=1 Tax=Chenopodium quinoa TaxID=63459 RepID=UPI000B78B581|nr:uncharacterized protein LOC110693495 [Chenopodium quinoa]
MSRYMTIKGRENGVDVMDFPIRMIKVDGPKAAANVDCGVFCLYHCASYFGKSFKSYRLNQIIERRRYRAEICASLVLSDLNKIRDNVLSRVDDFVKNNEAIMIEVLRNEKLVREAEIEALKAEPQADLERRRKAKSDKEATALVAATIAAEEAAAKRKSKRNNTTQIGDVEKEEAALVAATIAAEQATLNRKSIRNVSAAAPVQAVLSRSRAPVVKRNAPAASSIVPAPASKSTTPTYRKKN